MNIYFLDSMKITCAFYAVEILNHERCKGVGECGINVFCFFVMTVRLLMTCSKCGLRMCRKDNVRVLDFERKRMIFFLV